MINSTTLLQLISNDTNEHLLKALEKYDKDRKKLSNSLNKLRKLNSKYKSALGFYACGNHINNVSNVTVDKLYSYTKPHSTSIVENGQVARNALKE